MNLLELKNIKKYYPIRKGLMGINQEIVRAVDHVSLSVVKGENLGLVGESGCGKTTLAKVIMKLITADSGQIYLEGKDITRLKGKNLLECRRSMQMVFQDPYSSLDPRFTVERILAEGLHLEQKKFLTRAERTSLLEEALKAVKLNPKILSRYPHEFSGGERQRIAIARALLLKPKLVILDEAVSNLDVLIQKEILDLLAHLRQQYALTYLFVSHNLRVIRRVCERVAVMYQGKIVELGPTQDVFQNPLYPYTKELLTAALDYKVADNAQKIIIKPQAKLVDRGGGHLVLDHELC
jgi:ABC-type oligopeptide transport system ATPase subunit